MRKPVSVLAILALFTAALTLPAIADDEKTVNATVQPLVIALNVDPASLSYGTKQLGLTAVEPNGPFAVINTGSVSEQFLIRGGNSSPGGWTLGITAGNNVYVHRFKASVASTFTELSTTNKNLASSVLPSGTFLVNLNLDMPTGTTSLSEQTLPVTVVATMQQP